MKALRRGLLLAGAAAMAVALVASVGARPPLPEAGIAKKRTVAPDVAGYAKQHGPHSQFECIAASGGANTNLDCDDPFPNNEPDIAVNPLAPGHLIASSNDYGSCCDQYYTTLNGGSTWSTGNMSVNNPQQTGSDPVTEFDRKHGVAIHSSLNYSFQNPTGEACRGDLVVSIVDRRRHHVAASGRRRIRGRLRSLQHPALQRQGVDRHRQQPVLAVLRPYLPDLVEVHLRERRVPVVADLRVALGRRRQALDEVPGDLGLERARARSR